MQDHLSPCKLEALRESMHAMGLDVRKPLQGLLFTLQKRGSQEVLGNIEKRG